MSAHGTPKSTAWTSPAAPGAVVAATWYLTSASTATVVLRVRGATGGNLDTWVQATPDGGTSWFDIARLPTVSAAAAEAVYLLPLSRVAVLSPTAPVLVGTSSSAPVISANTVVSCDPMQGVRILQLAGAGTSAGASQSAVMWAANGGM